MKNAPCAYLLLFALSQAVFARPEPNFIGTWVLTQINGHAVSGPVAILPLKNNGWSRITISQKGNEFLIEGYSARYPNKEEKYVVDGTERKLHQIGVPDSTYYIAKWEGESLIIDKESDHFFPNGGKWTSHNREVWSISADGKNLTHSYDKILTEVFQKERSG